MVYFKRNKFAGIAPAVAPKLLADQFGQIAADVDLSSGKILGSKTNADTTFSMESGTRSVYRYEYGTGSVEYLQWEEDDISVAKGPIPDDSFERLYWTGEDFPRIGWRSTIIGAGDVHPSSSYRLGVPRPTNTPTTSVSGSGTDTLTAYEVSYVYTLVTADGREGPPSPASNTTSKIDGQTVTVTIPTPTLSGGNHNFGDGALKRIYRSNTGSNSTQFQFVAQVAYTATTYDDTKASYELQEVIPSTTWIGPPDDDGTLYPDGPMQGLIPLAQGVMAGFSGNRFCLSEAFLPHAWPISYRITTDEPIVAISASNNGVVALTNGRPYFITGTDPSAMTAITVDLAQACINKHSVVDMGEYVLYASSDGLCMVQGASGSVVTEGLIPPDIWKQNYHPGSYKAFLYEGKYVAFQQQGGTNNFIFDPTGGENTFTTFNHNRVYAADHDPKSGRLYIYRQGGTVLEKFRKGTTLNDATFRSKKYVTPSPVSMGWVSIEAGEYPVTVKVYADGTLIAHYEIDEHTTAGKFTQTTTVPSGISAGVLSEPVMRLPAVVGQVWEVEVVGKDIDSYCLAQSIDEVKGT